MLTECCPCVYITWPTIDPREHTLSVKHCGNYAGMYYVCTYNIVSCVLPVINGVVPVYVVHVYDAVGSDCCFRMQ